MTSGREELLGLIARWEEARAGGRSPPPEEVCRDCPERLDEFRRTLERLARLHWLDGPLDEATVSTPRPAGTAGEEEELPRTLAGRYRLDALVGVGGFGRVYRGFDAWLERPVAVKVPKSGRTVEDEGTDLCRTEAKKVARLRHPHIVPVHDVGRDGGTCFIVSEWIEGLDLATRLRGDRPPHREAARVVAEVADALGHAHARGYVHRDVKPANILLDASGRAYLTDFGIAVGEEDLLEEAGAVGTLPYMAPEQLTGGGGRADHRADIFALGVVLFELLTGRRPFEAACPSELRGRIVAGAVPPPSSIEPGVPEALERLCLRCLSPAPVDRYQVADLLAADLRAFLGP